MNSSPLTARIARANDAGRTALIPFLTAGYPTLRRFWEILENLDTAGADIIEIGVPFSDPVADGPVVEAASHKALENGVSLSWILQGLMERKGRFKAGLVLMGYYNPFLQYGLERLAVDARSAGVEGCIVPDLPLGEDAPFRSVLAGQGLDLIPLVGLNTSPERMAAYARSACGYAYLVSVLGTTGERRGFPPELHASLHLARTTFSVPVALGFGLSSPDQLDGLEEKPAAVVFGSALLRHVAEGGDGASFIRRWQA